MKTINVFLIFVYILLNIIVINARSKRVDQIPNGSKFNCQNCHINEGGGGAKNDFGTQVGNNYLDNGGDVIWGSELAGLDADQDGSTNGQELEDPDGEWEMGDSDPGDQSLVTNPGDPNSVAIEKNKLTYKPKNYTLQKNYPNPFNRTTKIIYSITKTMSVKLSIYNVSGKHVITLRNGIHKPGNYNITWSGKNEKGQKLESGVYFAHLESVEGASTIKILFLK